MDSIPEGCRVSTKGVQFNLQGGLHHSFSNDLHSEPIQLIDPTWHLVWHKVWQTNCSSWKCDKCVFISTHKKYFPAALGTQRVHEFHENHHSVTFYFIKKDSKRCSDTTTPESIHTKDESKRGSAFAFIFGVN